MARRTTRREGYRWSQGTRKRIEEVYLKAYAGVLEAQRGLEDYFRFYNGIRPGATGPQPRCSSEKRVS